MGGKEHSRASPPRTPPPCKAQGSAIESVCDGPRDAAMAKVAEAL